MAGGAEHVAWESQHLSGLRGRGEQRKGVKESSGRGRRGGAGLASGVFPHR